MSGEVEVSYEGAKAVRRRSPCFCKDVAGRGRALEKGDRSTPARKSVWEKKRRARARRRCRRGARDAGGTLEGEAAGRRVKRVVNFRRIRRNEVGEQVGAEGWLWWKIVRKAVGGRGC